MAFSTRTVIEITDRSIKVVQGTVSGNYQLTFAEMLIGEHFSDEDIIGRLQGLKSKGLNLSGSEIILNIPRQNLILCYLDLPSDNKEELKAMVNLQALNHVPYAREEIVIDFLQLFKNAEGYTKVLVVVSPEETVKRLEKCLAVAHMSPHKITASFIGQWQWYRTQPLAAPGVTVLLDIDAQKSEICFFDANKVLVSRPTTLGMAEVNTKVNEKFLDQLDWTMTSYVKEQLGPPIAQIIITSSLREEMESLQADLEIKYSVPVRFVCTLNDVNAKKNWVWPRALNENAVSITSAIGLIRSKETIFPVDLVSRAVKESKDSVARAQQGIRFGILMVVALTSLVLCFSLNFFKQKSYLDQIEKEIKSAQKKVSEIKVKQKRLDLLRDLIENRVVFIDIIKKIYGFLPEGVVFTNLKLTSDHNLILQGYSTKNSDINQLQKSLVAFSDFDNVNLDYVNKRVTVDGELNYFKITCHIKTKGPTNEKT